MIVESVRTVKARFSEFLDLVVLEREQVTITRNGRPEAVLLSMSEYRGHGRHRREPPRYRSRSRHRRGGNGGAPNRTRGTPSAQSSGRFRDVTARYRVHMTAAVQRIVRTRLPEDLAVGVLALATRSLAIDPRGSGEPLRRQLDGLWAAEREEYVLHYEIDDDDRVVVIVGILPKPGSRLF